MGGGGEAGEIMIVDSTFLRASLVEGVLVAELKCEKIAEREAKVIEDEIAQAAPASRGRVVINAKAVGLLASVGLGSLITIGRNCKKAGGDLALCHISDDILKVLKLTRLDKVLKICPDVASAVKAVT